MKRSTAIFLLVSIITLCIAQPSGFAFWRYDSDSADTQTRINGTVLQRPAGYAATDSNENFEARQATITFVPILLHKHKGKTAAGFSQCLSCIDRCLHDMQRLLPGCTLQVVIRIAPIDPLGSHISDEYCCDIDLYRANKGILGRTLTDGSGTEGIVVYISTGIFPEDPTRMYDYSYLIFGKGAQSVYDGRLPRPTMTAPTEMPRVPAPIAAIANALGVTLIYRTRQRNERARIPVCRRQTPTIKMTIGDLE